MATESWPAGTVCEQSLVHVSCKAQLIALLTTSIVRASDGASNA